LTRMSGENRLRPDDGCKARLEAVIPFRNRPPQPAKPDPIE